MTIDCLKFYFPGLDHVHCIFSTRHGGLSAGPYASANLSLEVGDNPEIVKANREYLRARLGFKVWQELHQVHGQTVFLDLEDDFFAGPNLDGDGLYTRYPSHGLVIETADCQAIMCTDILGRYVGAVHCGWRGNAANFPGLGIEKFCQHYGLDPDQVLVVRGPSLGPGKSEFVNFDQEWDCAFWPYFNPVSRKVDLWQLTQDQLMAAGILAEHIYALDLCTASSDQFFSYRRDKVTGRQIGVIWRE